MPKAKTDEAMVETKAPVTFSKAQILTFKRFATRRDLLKVKLGQVVAHLEPHLVRKVKTFSCLPQVCRESE